MKNKKLIIIIILLIILGSIYPIYYIIKKLKIKFITMN